MSELIRLHVPRLKTGAIEIQDIQHIRHHVNEPCADCYIQNRKILKNRLKMVLAHNFRHFLGSTHRTYFPLRANEMKCYLGLDRILPWYNQKW